MYISAESLDDLLLKVYERLLKVRKKVLPRKGSNAELQGVLLRIGDPRMRFSRTEIKSTLVSCLGELVWYLSGSNELAFIQYYIERYGQYSDDGTTIHGAYGPRMFSDEGTSQFSKVRDLLKQHSDTRKAVIQIFDASDTEQEFKDVPCTCTLQFMARYGRLHLFVNMRSNDAYRGLPHDVFAFTMIQEIMARSLGLELGTYKHAVASLHLYDDCRESAEQFIREAFQEKIPMPPMPKADPFLSIPVVLDYERRIRQGERVPVRSIPIDPYWADLIRILRFHSYAKRGRSRDANSTVVRYMHSNVYDAYFRKVQAKAQAKEEDLPQKELFPPVLSEASDEVPSR